jgi:hypothetical protein
MIELCANVYLNLLIYLILFLCSIIGMNVIQQNSVPCNISERTGFLFKVRSNGITNQGLYKGYILHIGIINGSVDIGR